MWFAAKTALALAIVAGVARYFHGILTHSQFDARRLTVRFELLVPAAGLYLLAHCCWATFWVRLLHFEGVRVSWALGLRAYFVSQLGKYVPGKAWVILLRVGILRHYGGHPLPVAVTATYEALCSMAAGSLLGVLLLPQLGIVPAELSSNVSALFAVAALPVALGVLNRLAAKVVAKKRGPDARPLPSPSVFLLSQGLVHGALGHCLLGLSLGLTIAAVVPQSAPITDTYPADLGATTISYVAGFVALVVPGGLGVREYVLKVALTPRFAESMGEGEAAGLAVVIALVLRLTWTVAEVLVAGVLYLLPAPPPTFPPHHNA